MPMPAEVGRRHAESRLQLPQCEGGVAERGALATGRLSGKHKAAGRFAGGPRSFEVTIQLGHARLTHTVLFGP